MLKNGGLLKKVLAFAFGGDGKNTYLPHNYIRNCTAYTGIHDNDTVRGWFQCTVSQNEIEHAKIFEFNTRRRVQLGIHKRSMEQYI